MPQNRCSGDRKWLRKKKKNQVETCVQYCHYIIVVTTANVNNTGTVLVVLRITMICWCWVHACMIVQLSLFCSVWFSNQKIQYREFVRSYRVIRCGFIFIHSWMNAILNKIQIWLFDSFDSIQTCRSSYEITANEWINQSKFQIHQYKTGCTCTTLYHVVGKSGATTAVKFSTHDTRHSTWNYIYSSDEKQ